MSNDPKNPSRLAMRLDRRAALARLGIGAAVAYSAPTVLHLDRSANATLAATPCSRSGNRPPFCRQGSRRGPPPWARNTGNR
jgi:hypothetical protein